MERIRSVASKALHCLPGLQPAPINVTHLLPLFPSLCSAIQPPCCLLLLVPVSSCLRAFALVAPSNWIIFSRGIHELTPSPPPGLAEGILQMSSFTAVSKTGPLSLPIPFLCFFFRAVTWLLSNSSLECNSRYCSASTVFNKYLSEGTQFPHV